MYVTDRPPFEIFFRNWLLRMTWYLLISSISTEWFTVGVSSFFFAYFFLRYSIYFWSKIQNFSFLKIQLKSLIDCKVWLKIFQVCSSKSRNRLSMCLNLELNNNNQVWGATAFIVRFARFWLHFRLNSKFKFRIQNPANPRRMPCSESQTHALQRIPQNTFSSLPNGLLGNS